jgi:hypothetical protein
MRKRVAIAGVLLAVAATLVFAQYETGGDPWWRPKNPSGQSFGVTVGNALPTTELTAGELAVDVDGNSLHLRTTGGAWLTFGTMPLGGLTNDFVPVWNGTTTALEDSSIRSVGVPAAGAGGSIVDITETLLAMDNNDDTNGLFLDFTNANHTGANNTFRGLHVDGITADAQATESAIYIGSGWDRDIEFEDTAEVIFLPSTFDLILGTTSPGAQFEFTDVNAAGAGSNLLTISGTLGIMDDGTDLVRGLYVNLTNVNHTNGFMYGLDVGGITPDANSGEFAIGIQTGWDVGVYFTDGDSHATAAIYGLGNFFHLRQATGVFSFGDGTRAGGLFSLDTNNFPDAVADYADSFLVRVGAGATVAVMDNNDVYSMLTVDFTNANHTGTGNVLQGLYVDSITGDADAYETVMRLGGGWDTHITFIETGASPPDNPPTGQIGMFVDDNADYSGGGGNDCILGLIDSTGAIDIVTTIVLNGACP